MMLRRWMLGILLGGLSLAGAGARADIIQSYNFSGTLAALGPGLTLPGQSPQLTPDPVTGHFTLDLTTATITDFSFTMVGAIVDPAHGYDFAAINPFFVTPNLVRLWFCTGAAQLGCDSNAFVLSFQTTLLAFSGGSFDANDSSLDCDFSICDLSFATRISGGSFTGGSATIVPEPSPLTALLPAVALYGAYFRRRITFA